MDEGSADGRPFDFANNSLGHFSMMLCAHYAIPSMQRA
jgi:hypothetical protein